MLFNSYQYLIFFPLVVVCFFSMPFSWRVPLLLAASYVFYMSWNPSYVLLIGISTIVAFSTALLMAKEENENIRLCWFFCSVGFNLGILFAFKYYGLLDRVIYLAGTFVGQSWGVPAFDVLLPVGISFYTFQTLSYSVEIYNKNTSPEESFLKFALFVSFFPQLVAGPIERPTKLLPQFDHHSHFDYSRVVNGLKLIVWGLFKKMVVADRLAVVVNSVYN